MSSGGKKTPRGSLNMHMSNGYFLRNLKIIDFDSGNPPETKNKNIQQVHLLNYWTGSFPPFVGDFHIAMSTLHSSSDRNKTFRPENIMK